jgi:transposase-like protein
MLAPPTISVWDHIPLPTVVGAKLALDRHQWENFKRDLQGLPPDDSPSGHITFVTLKQAAAEIGCHPKSLKKWIRLRLARKAGKPVPAPERTSTIVKRNSPRQLAKRSTRALETV